MTTAEHYDVLVTGSGEAGKYLAWPLVEKRPSDSARGAEDGWVLVPEHRLFAE